MGSKWNIANIDRWISKNPHTWPFRVFKQYDEELMRLIISVESTGSYTFNKLTIDGALKTSLACDYGISKSNTKQTIQEWCDNYNNYTNWFRLSLLMSISAFFETYMAAIIHECVESDPGILLGMPHSVDGVEMLKKGKKVKDDQVRNIIKSCTKGTWSERSAHLSSFFNDKYIIDGCLISMLEKIRKIRNDYGHAFGRDIESAQQYNSINKSEITHLSKETFNKYHRTIVKLVQEIDEFAISNHIGNFEPLYHYHTIYDDVKDMNKGQKMERLKLTLSVDKKSLFSKDFCRGVILYYESL